METNETSQASESKPTRETRLNLRATARQNALIRQAAQATSKTVSEFVLDSASNAAEQVLADRRWFMLDESSWAAFQDLLERPAVIKPRLAELLAKESHLFDD
jgi:uncharacterized protein (DUF1778 family)